MDSRISSERQMRAATLAGQILPVVRDQPQLAYAAEVARRLPKDESEPYWRIENDVGIALRFMEEQQLLTSHKARHPLGWPTKVRLYSLTPIGAFMLSLATTTQTTQEIG